MSSPFASIEDRLNKFKGVGPGFDLVRIGLAAAIFFGHCFWAAGGNAHNNRTIFGSAAPIAHSTPLIWHGQSNFRHLLVPMFFAVSGFLVTGSAFRTGSLSKFLSFRILRIIPALGTEVFLSALVLGPLLTTSTLREYFSDPNFRAYFGNIVGHVHMLLPGVFLDNPATRSVNVNLWTLPAEFYCYFIIAILLASGLLVRRVVFSVVFALITIVLVALEQFTSLVDMPTNGLLSNTLIVYYFFCGCLLYHWKHHLPYSWVLFVISVAASYFFNDEGDLYLTPLFASYVIIFIGMTKLPRIDVIQRGDYSYGVYLYGFPITQALVVFIPGLRGHGWTLLVVGGALTFLFAMVSWHFIEKPALGLKKIVTAKRAPELPSEQSTETG